MNEKKIIESIQPKNPTAQQSLSTKIRTKRKRETRRQYYSSSRYLAFFSFFDNFLSLSHLHFDVCKFVSINFFMPSTFSIHPFCLCAIYILTTIFLSSFFPFLLMIFFLRSSFIAFTITTNALTASVYLIICVHSSLQKGRHINGRGLPDITLKSIKQENQGVLCETGRLKSGRLKDLYSNNMLLAFEWFPVTILSG